MSAHSRICDIPDCHPGNCLINSLAYRAAHSFGQIQAAFEHDPSKVLIKGYSQQDILDWFRGTVDGFDDYYAKLGM